uniref:Tnp_DDE_dom domain-containing protein n=1 Tax=Mesocestoides corti TaxID=53468 RepID=A0A5K3G312_MESCO
MYFCKQIYDLEESGYILSCAYDHADNEVVERPYEKGESCSRCPYGYSCLRNQCSEKHLPQPPSDSTDTTVMTTSPVTDEDGFESQVSYSVADSMSETATPETGYG